MKNKYSIPQTDVIGFVAKSVLLSSGGYPPPSGNVNNEGQNGITGG